MVQKLIIDVDTGVDDAEAIMIALTQPDVQILAITCVNGNTNVDQAIYNTHRVLQMWNATEIPVYRGAEFSLIGGGHDAAYFHGSDGMGEAQHAGPTDLSIPDLPNEHAAAAIVRLVNQFPGEITLVALAPLTNIALALHFDPNLGKKLKKCVIMGGTLDAIGNTPNFPCAEFNFSCDPEAASLVLSRMSCVIHLVTWKACHDCHIEWDEIDKIFAIDTDRGRFHSAFMKNPLSKKRARYTSFHSCDPCAIMVALDPSSILETIDAFVTIELHGKLTRGQSVIDFRNEMGKPNVHLITGMDSSKLFHMMKAAVL